MIKKVKVNANQKALLYKSGCLVEILGAGNYWRRSSIEVEYMNISEAFRSKYDSDLLVKNQLLMVYLDVVEVKDDELVLQYLNGNFNKVLAPGRYIYWKGVKEFTYRYCDLSSVVIPADISRKLLQNVNVLPWIRVYNVTEFEKGILYIDGEFKEILEAGTYYFWKNEKNIVVYKSDLRVQQMEISGQEILTKDKANLRINFYADYQVTDMIKSLVETKDCTKQFYTMMQLVLREYVGKYSIDDLLANKDEIGNFVKDAASQNAAMMGITIQSCGIRDIILPGDVKEIMNQVLIAEKKAQANVIMRREETASTRSLLNTAKLMEDNEMLYKLKEMEYVEKIAENIENITLSGGSQLIDQLKSIFVSKNN